MNHFNDKFVEFQVKLRQKLSAMGILLKWLTRHMQHLDLVNGNAINLFYLSTYFLV